MEDSELTQRRERGRMAQRAFRQRQITTIRELKDKNQALADAIDNVTQTAALFSHMEAPGSHDKVMLEIGIQKARRLAGLAPLGESSSVIQGQDSDDYFLHADGYSWADPSSIFESIESQSETRTLGSSNITSLPTRPLGNSASPSATSTVPLTIAQGSDASSRGSSPSMTISVEGMYAGTSSIADINNQALPVSGQYNSTTSTTDYFTPQDLIPISTAVTQSQTMSATGRVSPRLTYGLWFEPDRFIRIINPPRDIIPYLGDSTNSLAGAIFWAGLGFGYTILKKVLRMRAISSSSAWQSQPTITYPSTTSDNTQNQPTQPPSSPPHPDARAASTRIFGHAIRAAGPNADAEQILHDVIHARFTWRKHGYIAGDHPGADPDIPTRLFAEVVKEMMTSVPFPAPTSRIIATTTTETNPPATTATWSAGLRLWMTPLEVEGYVRARLSDTATSQFAGRSETWMSWEGAFRIRSRRGVGYTTEGLSSEVRARLLRKLVRVLSDKGVCFGNSPRWRVDVVSLCVDEWVGDVEREIMVMEGFGGGAGAGEGLSNMSDGFGGFGFGLEGGIGGGGGGICNNGLLMGGYGARDGVGVDAGGSSSSSMYGSDFFAVAEGGNMEGLVF